MSRTYKDATKGSGRDRHVSVRGVRRRQPDLPRMSRALVRLALEEAAAEATAEAQPSEQPTKDGSTPQASND